MGAPVKIFVSYAEEDRKFLVQLDKHLINLQRRGFISLWHDQRLLAGDTQRDSIDKHLQAADLILLLISSDYLASAYSSEQELHHILLRQKTGQTRIIPILVRPTDWEMHELSSLGALPQDARPISTWPDQDEAWVDVTWSIQAVIMGFNSQRGHLHPTALPSLWSVPYNRNPFFAGRDEILSQLATSLMSTDRVTALTQTQAVSGLGGIGKTQLAIEYAYRFQERYQAILWAGAETYETLVAAYMQLAALLRLPEHERQNQNQIIAAMKQWLHLQPNWLLILDNVEDLELLSTFLPSRHQGHVLLTTRLHVTEPVALALQLDCFSDEDGALLLLRRIKRVAPGGSLDETPVEDRQQALKISHMLGGLPLAIDQAGAYILETGCTLTDYVSFYEKRSREFLVRRGKVPLNHPESVASTFTLVFEQVKRKNRAAIELLQLCAFLAPDAIPEAFLTKVAGKTGSVLDAVLTNPMAFNDTLETLRTFSLMQRNGEKKVLSLHRLIQVVLRNEMSQSRQRRWNDKCIYLLDQAFPSDPLNVEQWDWCEQLIPHVMVSAALRSAWSTHVYESSNLFLRVARYLSHRQQYEVAEALYQYVLHISEQTLGPDHKGVAQILISLWVISYTQGKHESAGQYYQRALAIYERVFGSEHQETALALGNIAGHFSKLGKYELAKQHGLRSLLI